MDMPIAMHSNVHESDMSHCTRKLCLDLIFGRMSLRSLSLTMRGLDSVFADMLPRLNHATCVLTASSQLNSLAGITRFGGLLPLLVFSAACSHILRHFTYGKNEILQ